MTPQETALLQNAGETFIRNASVMLLIAIAYGIYLLTAALAVSSLLRPRDYEKSFAIWTLLAAVCVTFMVTTAYCAVYFAIVFGLMRVSLVDNILDPLATRFALAGQSIQGVSIAQGWLGGICGFIFLIGDAATSWRAWAISFEHRKPVYGIFLLFLSGLGCSIGYNVLNTPPPPFVFTGSALWILQLLGLILPLMTNVFATALIGYRAYKYKGFVKATLGRPGRSKAAKIMMVLTESGFVYSIIQAINVTLILTDDAPLSSPQDQATRLWGQLTLFVSAMLPLVIILIVSHQRSMTDTIRGTDIPASVSAEFEAGTHISFAHSPAGTGQMGFQPSKIEAEGMVPTGSVADSSVNSPVGDTATRSA
ncbi:hypothetical protein C8R45DRAFT_502974 [Mycena sanguinolenta]|nr:hypothetical protein C8R45DRAFT_502974 [Mycena sanguinolenta]